MEETLNVQSKIEQSIEKLLSNFKKEPKERRTQENISRRLETLELYWKEYTENHYKLLLRLPKDHDYILGQYFEKTRKNYLETREYIEKRSIINPDEPKTSSEQEEIYQDPMGGNINKDGPSKTKLNPVNQEQQETSKANMVSAGNNSKLDEMLKKQLSNFKAFARTVSSINIENINDKWELEDTLKSLQARWTAIDSIHWEIDSDLDGSNKMYEDRFTEHEQKFYDMKKAINSKLWSASHREKSTPQLDIPAFSGNYQQWVSFKDLFCEAIHKNPSISNAQKLQFLKSKLKGEAERLIQHLHISVENYPTAWEILNNRYNNKKLIFSTHMNTLMNLPVMQQSSSNNIKRIHDVTTECLNAIKNLGVNIETWDPILVHILVQKLDSETHADYLESLKQPRELPNLNEFLSFMENKFTTMESARKKQENYQQKSMPQNSNKQERSYKYYASNKATSRFGNWQNYKLNCPVCKSPEHGIYYCKQFLEQSPAQKRQTIMNLNFCANCLFSHGDKPCTSNKRCRECNGCHNTILHAAFLKGNSNMTPNGATRRHGNNYTADTRPWSEQTTQNNASNVAQGCHSQEILLATALINIQGADGEYRKMRALIDQGSQVSLITENAAQLLRVPRRKCKGIITGIGTKDNSCTGMININCSSLTEEFTFNTDAYIMKSLTRNLPNQSFTRPQWGFLKNIPLADPEFNVSRPIDVLLGADVYSNIILAGICKTDNMTPVAQQTRLGYILCGKVPTLQCNVVVEETEALHKFWEIEDIAEEPSYSTEDTDCVNFYKSTTTRLIDGKYQVRLPLKPNFDQLGQSKNKAIAQFLQLERKFNKNQEMAKEYKQFIHEYQELGHMKVAIGNKKTECYLPHHCVIRDSTTSSHRVVFNASQCTSSGESLNDYMCKGPNLQKDLLTLILEWRQYKIAFTADIEKMFRQIWVHEEDQALQKIVWRENPHNLLQEFQLTTVTYGTKAAPFLAMMTLRQLADDEQNKYPEAAQVVQNRFYMDDLLHGSHSLESAQKLKQDLINLMKAGGFNLRKWNSNYPELQWQQEQEPYSFKQMESTKTLGLNWNPKQDTFTFQSRISDNENKTSNDTKRSLLSDISKQFDPLGWLTPLSTTLKLLFQKAWKTNMAWDEKLPENIKTEWKNIKSDIKNIDQITIPRWIGSDATCKIELHGFSDSSQKAYGCVIYSKILKPNQNTQIILVAGKSRLAPCNKDISLPRLELSGALLLSKLMKTVKQALSSYQDIKVYGWIDSTAVLGWLQGNPERWKPFVTNRVREITKIMPSDQWRYVKSTENPADCASRGLTTSQLLQHPLWWHGPHWLPTYNSNIKQEQSAYTTDEEKRKEQDKQVSVITLNTGSSVIKDLIDRYGSFNKIVRVLAWVRRFNKKNQENPRAPWLTLSEIRKAKECIVKQVQSETFQEEIRDLKEGKQVSSKSKISNLNPYLDENQVLRVGGRLMHAHISPEMKNPAILPQNHRLTELVINHAHGLTFHGGARVTLAFTRQKYWILSGNRTTKKYIRKCVTCRRQQPTMNKQIMGHLPEPRVNPSRPFKHTGVDFTGHVLYKASKGRGVKTSKGYVAVFVCMATKAIHLELVSDLSTSAFIAALRRMAARRGMPEHIYCDNGSNFVGASRILQEEYQEIQQIFNEGLQNELTDMEIKFHFNAPSWPSAGGLWESSVKSLKFHLKRTIGEQKLTFEEYSTLLSQIEACLNSRPLCALSEDPEDLNYLTPAHFLTNGPMLTLVETERDLRTRWQLTQKLLQDIWKRWRAEYLSQLTARSKWRGPHNNININDVVIVHNENLPPGKWIIGRVVELHPGKDGYVRVVTLKTKSGYMRRPIIKLSLLTSEQDDPTNNLNEKECDEHANTANKQRKTRKNKISSLTSLFTAFLFFMSIVTSSQCNINVTKFRDNQGLYFDKITDMMLIKDEWKLVVFYQMDPYWQGNKALNSYIDTLEKACNTMREQAHCHAILLQLRHGYIELQYYNQMLLSQQGSARSIRQPARRRRGLINGVGYLASSLFGVLDERFAEQYKEDINKLQANQNHIINLWRNQTSIIESENNLLKRTEIVMNQQYKTMNQHLLSMEEAMNNLKDSEQANRDLNEFAIGSILANNVLSNLKNLQNTLLETVTDTYQGRFNLHLLTPEQLIDELSTISSKLPRDVSLPVDNIHSELRKLYRLIKIKTRMVQEILLFEIRIPLIGRETYEILKLIPIPKLQANKAIRIVPVSDYVAMNLKKDTFILMSELDVRACIALSETYYCHSQNPEYQMKSDTNFCEMNAKECKTTVSLCKDKWQDSYSINTYIYFCCETCQVRAMCEDQVTAHQLTSTGLINIGHGCIIKTDTFTIYPHKPHASEVRLSPNLYTPTIAPINHIINLTIPKSELILNKSHLDVAQEASIIQDRIQDLKQQEVLPENVTYHDVHHYVMIYVVLTLIIIIGGTLMIRHVRGRRNTAQTSVIEIRETRRDEAAAAVSASPPQPPVMPRPKETLRQSCRPRKETDAASSRFANKSTSPILRKFSDVFSEDSV